MRMERPRINWKTPVGRDAGLVAGQWASGPELDGGSGFGGGVEGWDRIGGWPLRGGEGHGNRLEGRLSEGRDAGAMRGDGGLAGRLLWVADRRWADRSRGWFSGLEEWAVEWTMPRRL